MGQHRFSIVSLFHQTVRWMFLVGILGAGEAGAVSPPRIQHPPVIITAQRYNQNVSEIPANITVLDAKDIENSGARSVPELLQQALGVHVVNNSTAKSSVVDIRGFGDTAGRNVLVLVNGRRINAIDISGADLVQVPVEAVERVEVIRGAGSVLYGDNAVGGVVNIITKQGRGPLSGKAGVSYGSYGSVGALVEAGGRRGETGYYGFAGVTEQGGYRANSDADLKDARIRLNRVITDSLVGEIQAGWHEDRQRLPGGLSFAQLESLGRRGTATPDDFTETRDRYVQGSLNFWPVDESAGYFEIEGSYRNRDVYDAFNSFGPFHTKRDTDVFGAGARYIFDRSLFSREVNFVTGVDYYNTTNDILGSGTNVDDITIKKTETGAYASLEFEVVEDIFLQGGTRYQQARYDFQQRNVVVDESVRPDEWVNMAGAAYTYGEGARIHATVQQTFRFLATDEWYSTANFPGFGITPGLNTDLQQQTGVQYELGWKHRWAGLGVSRVTPYWIDIKDEIFFDPVTFANSNYDATRRVGVELAQSLDVSPWINLPYVDRLDLELNLTLQEATFEEGANDGKTIPHIPGEIFSHTLSASIADHYRWSLQGRYVGSRFAINDTANETPKEKPYYVVDTTFGWTRLPWKLEAGIQNLLNEKYSQFVSKSTFSSAKNFFPAPERNYFLKMSVEF